MTKKQTIAVMVAALATLMLSLIDTNIVTSAATSIARDFGGKALSQIPWLITAYALAETITQPLYGKLTDRYGVRPMILSALALFTAGSILCGLAQSMPVLILFRVLQGLGAAGLLSVTFILIGHLRAERPDEATNGNALSGIMLGLGLICGPLLGGTILNHVTWRWIFWVNIPISIVLFLVLLTCLHLPTPTHKRPIDWLAAGWLAMAAATLQLICIWGGHDYRWLSWQIISLVALGVGSVMAFTYRQNHFKEPFFPPYLLRLQTLRALTVLQLLTGIGMAASIIYITLDFQLVHGSSPLHAGLQLIPMAIGVTAGAAVGAALLKSGRSIRASLIIGTALCAITLGGLAIVQTSTPLLILQLLIGALGFGVGIGLGNELIIIQNSIPLHDLGTATAGVRFIETLGTSAGAAAFGLVFSQALSNATSVHATARAIDIVFGLGAAVMAVATITALRLPHALPTRRPQTPTYPHPDSLAV